MDVFEEKLGELSAVFNTILMNFSQDEDADLQIRVEIEEVRLTA